VSSAHVAASVETQIKETRTGLHNVNIIALGRRPGPGGARDPRLFDRIRNFVRPQSSRPYHSSVLSMSVIPSSPKNIMCTRPSSGHAGEGRSSVH